MKKKTHTLSKGLLVLAVLVTIVLLLILISLNSGKMSVTPKEVWLVLSGQGTTRQNLIIYEFRLPRIILSLLVGMGMGISGSIMQSLLRNDMASPGTLGISSGSGLFVLGYIAIFSTSGHYSAFMMPILAFVGGITAALLIFLLSYRKGREISPTGLILTGVATGSGYGALTTLLMIRFDERQMLMAERWQAGDLWGAEWRYLAILGPWVILLSLYAIYKARILNTLTLGNETATGLGLAIKPEFLGLSLTSIALASGSVALGGNFFFVGMIAPHLARRLVGPNHKLFLPAAGLLGGLIILLADTITRSISFGTDVPTGIIITVLSTPYFLYLLSKAR